jgi:hypothetical protein
MSVVTALACLAALDDERAVCDQLAEAVARYMVADFASDDEMVAVGELRDALDVYHTHRGLQ